MSPEYLPDDPSVAALIALCKREGGYKAVADKIGANDQSLYQIISGVKMPSGNRKGVGPRLRKSLLEHYPEWLSQSDYAAPIDLENNPDYPAIRRVNFKLSAGASGFAIEYDQDFGAPIVFQRQWYEQRGLVPAKLFAVKVANGSMEPGLTHGDTVVVNTEQTTPRDGRVFAVNYEGELVIKRLVRDAGQWWLSSDNPDQHRYPRKVCDEHCLLIGEIVHKQSERI